MTSRISLYYGLNGTRKTSAALSDGCHHAEFDVGSLERAWKDKKSVVSRQFYGPQTSLRDMGKLSGSMMGTSGKGAVQVVHRYRGWNEKYWEFVQWFYEWLDGDATDLVLDTETKLWNMAQNAIRQRIQDEFPPEMWGDRLKRLEYAEPNSQMHGFIEEAKHKGKNLYFIAHQGEVWMGDKPTGVPRPDGWREIEDEMDVILRFYRDNHKPYAVIEKLSQFEELLGMKMEAPTYESIEDLLGAAAKLRAAGKPIPGNATDVVVQAAMLG